MSVKVFIDGSSGTTGLRIADRLAARPDIELLSISAEGRKDVNERAKVINSADLAFLCLPDAASKEVMPLLRPDVRVLDTSTAFRTDTAWDYGFPELKGQKEKIKNSYRVAVPGCYASGFISIARPLVELGLAPADYPFSCTGISGYSGGGKKMIAEYESADRPAHSKLDAPKSYGLGLAHKHLPEMQKISGLAHTPAFVPVVCDITAECRSSFRWTSSWLAPAPRRWPQALRTITRRARPFPSTPSTSRFPRMVCTPTPCPAATGWSCT